MFSEQEQGEVQEKSISPSILWNTEVWVVTTAAIRNGCEKQICIGKHKRATTHTYAHIRCVCLSPCTDKHSNSYFCHRKKCRCCNLLLLVLSEWKTQLCGGNDILQIGLQLLIGMQQAYRSLSLCVPNSHTHTHTQRRTHRFTSPLVTMHIDKPIQSTILWTFPALEVVSNVTFDYIQLSNQLISFS